MLAVGWLLGGTVGVGTVVYALGIGPLVQLFVRLAPKRWLAVRLGVHGFQPDYDGRVPGAERNND